MADTNGIGGRIESDLVDSGKLAAPLGRDVQRAAIAGSPHRIQQTERRPGRGILLVLVVRLVEKCIVVLLGSEGPCRRFHDAVEGVDSN